jgi:hypothetical protein
MSNETAEPTVANPGGLRPETQQAIGSMADAFRAAMSGDPKPTPEPAQEEPKAAEPPAPAPAPAPEPQPVEETEVKESPSSKDFKAIKNERDEWRTKFEELSGRYEESQGSSEEYEKLKAEYDKMSETLSLTNLERHPKFQEQYVKPMQAQIDRAKAYVPEDQRDALAKILSMPVSEARANALDDLVGDLPPSRQAYLQGILNRVDEISFERDAALAESNNAYQKLVEEENLISSQKSAERDKQLNKSFESMLKDAQENISVYQLRDGDEEWNTGVRERVNLAKKILMEQNSFEDAATAALWAASGGALVEQNAALVEHNRRLQTELNKLQGAEPNAAGSKVAATTKPRVGSGERAFSDRVLGELSHFMRR